MSTIENKQKVRRFFDEVCNKGEIKLIDEIFSEKVIFNGKAGNRDDVRNYINEIKNSFEKPHVEVKEQIAEEDRVATIRIWTGIMVKEYHGYQPTDKLMTWTEISVVRLDNKEIVEDWVVHGMISIVTNQREKNEIDKDLIGYLDKDYERKINYLIQQFNRMWTRFNFFITLESSLIAGKFLFRSDAPSEWFAWVGVSLSFCWYVFGANDKQLVNVYKYAVEKASEKLNSLLPLSKVYREDTYYYVGKSDIKYNEVKDKDLYSKDLKMDIFHWRFKFITITHLASLFPLILTIIWLIYVLKLQRVI